MTSVSAQSAQTNALEWRQIPIKNIRPDMLAYWFDPAHHSMPVEYKNAQNDMNSYPMVKFRETQPKFSESESTGIRKLNIPVGSTLFADDTNKVLWLRSTAVQFDAFKKDVEFLDRPIRKIDFDFQIMEIMSPEIAITQNNPALNRLFDTPKKNVTISFNSISQSKLKSLIQNGDAKVVKSSHLTILNNLTDKFTTATSMPVTVDIKHADDGNQILSTQADKDNQLFLEKRLSVVFTPTINNDDTLTIFMTIAANAELTYNTPSATDNLLWVKSLENGRGLTTVFTVHAGDSMLLTGYNSTMLGFDNENHPIVLSVKAQIEK
jgi:hypothetical protein